MQWTRYLGGMASRSQNGGGREGHHSLQRGESNGTLSVLGNDISKWVFHIVGMDDAGAVVLRKRLARSDWLALMENLPPLRIGMEACGSAHDWTRCVREHGHAVRLIAPRMVKKSKSACIYTESIGSSSGGWYSSVAIFI